MKGQLCDVCGGKIDFQQHNWTALGTGKIIHYSQSNQDCYKRNLAMALAHITHVKKWFTAEEYGALLKAVTEKCTTEKQLQFVGMLTKAFDKYGADSQLTERQKEWLEKVRG